jgi:hypothetical protein
MDVQTGSVPFDVAVFSLRFTLGGRPLTSLLDILVQKGGRRRVA